MATAFCVARVGRKARDPLVEAAERYAKRLRHYTKLDDCLVKDSNPEHEGRQLLALAQPSDVVIALDERGRLHDTRTWAEHVEKWQQLGQRRVFFMLGGADGHSPTLRQRADHVWSLSPLTLPHRLAHVVLLEQLYRVHSFLRGEPYHRDG